MTVRVDGQASKHRNVNAGAPQGSVLGTYIFNVGTDTLEEEFEHDIRTEEYELNEGDLSFLESLPPQTYAQSTPLRRTTAAAIPLSPITRSDIPIRIEFLPTARNVPARTTRIEPTWRPKPLSVKKFVDDNLQNEKLYIKKVPLMIEGPMVYKNARAGQSEAMFNHIGKRAKERGLRVNTCLLYTSPSPRDRQKSRMPSSA